MSCRVLGISDSPNRRASSPFNYYCNKLTQFQYEFAPISPLCDLCNPLDVFSVLKPEFPPTSETPPSVTEPYHSLLFLMLFPLVHPNSLFIVIIRCYPPFTASVIAHSSFLDLETHGKWTATRCLPSFFRCNSFTHHSHGPLLN